MKLIVLFAAILCGVHGQSTCTYPTECKLRIQAYSALNSAGCTDDNAGILEVNGARVWFGMWCTQDASRNRRGVNTFLLDPYTCAVSDARAFDTYASASDADDLRSYIDYLESGKILIGITGDEPSQNLASARRLLRSAGVRVDDVQLRGSFAFVIQRGHPERTSFAKTVANTVAINTKLSVTIPGTRRCRINPCKNGAKCEQCGTSVTCTCPAGWTGALCDTVQNPCSSGPCKNGGSCSATGATFTCSCPAGWTGSDCTTVQNPCLSGPCKNGGSCSATGATFTCSCIPGWAGSDCTTDVNVCLEGNPCKNGGSCVKFGNSYECKCAANWAGTNCEMGSAACHAVQPADRINCGWGGVSLAECNERSCCFDPMTSRPACFYAVDDCATIDQNLRADCGFAGISEAQCLGRGCCYDDDDSNPGPICYRKANPECLGVAAAKRVAKGAPGIQPNECTAKGWCWDSSAVPNCYSKA